MADTLRELVDFFGQYVDFSPEELEVLMSCAELRKVKKRELLFECGEVARRVWFLREGFVRFFHFNSDGGEITRDFIFAPGFITPFRSFINGEPSLISIQAMADMEVVGWERDKLYALYDVYPRVERIGRLMAEQTFLSSEKHLLAFLNESPQQRYLWLLREYPEFIKNIPLVYLASWLGITPETLSRIRRRTML